MARMRAAKAKLKEILQRNDWQGQLGEDFYRCHRAYIVNMDCITEYDSESITLTNGDRVYLTKKKYGEFVKAYMWHLQNGGVSSV